MDHKDYKEFLGTAIISDSDGERLFFFDEISHGLFSMDLCNFIVEPVLSPQELFPTGYYLVLNVISNTDSIIIIPFEFKNPFIVYDRKKKSISRIMVGINNQKISDVFRYNDKLLFLPYTTGDSIVTLDYSLRIVEYNDNWYRENDVVDSWGGAVDKEMYVIPIIGSKMVYLNTCGIVSLDIDEAIAAVCLLDNSIWGISQDSRLLYQFDYDGQCICKIDIPTNKLTNRQDHFIRFITMNETIWLVSVETDRILGYYSNKDSFFESPSGTHTMVERKLMEGYGKENRTFWGYYKYCNNLWLLQNKYRLLEIDVDKPENSCEKKMLVDKSFMEEHYYEWIKYSNSKTIFQESKDAKLNHFLDYIDL